MDSLAGELDEAVDALILLLKAGARAPDAVAIVEGALSQLAMAHAQDNKSLFFAAAERMSKSYFADAGASSASKHLPEQLVAIVDDMASFVDDWVTEPDLARTFASDPRTLLERLRSLKLRRLG